MHLQGVHPAILLLLPPLARFSVHSTTFLPFLQSRKLCQRFFGSLVLYLCLRNRRTRNRKPESLEFGQVFRRFAQRNQSPPDRSRWNKYKVSFFPAVLYPTISCLQKIKKENFILCNLIYRNSSFNIFRRFFTSFNIVTIFGFKITKEDNKVCKNFEYLKNTKTWYLEIRKDSRRRRKNSKSRDSKDPESRISESVVATSTFVLARSLYSEMNTNTMATVGFRMRTEGHEFLRYQRLKE